VRVIVPEQLFSAEARTLNPFLLPAVFHACMVHGHEVATEFDVTESVTFAAWRDSRLIDERELVNLVLRTSVQTEARETIDCTVVASAEPSDWTTTPPRIGPGDLVALLAAPLTILVENELNDGAFLKAVGFGFERDEFLRGLKSGRIRFDHAGGSEMRNIIVTRGPDRLRAHRMWAVFDSDALVPDQPSSEAQRKVDACVTAEIRHHMLLRRSIENYLPPEELDQATVLNHRDPTNRRNVGAFRRLRPNQRAHYNLKGGFDADRVRLRPGSPDARHRPSVDELFSGMMNGDVDALAGGFGKDIAALFVVAPERGRPGISEAARRRDGQEAEMIPLFRAIVRSL